MRTSLLAVMVIGLLACGSEPYRYEQAGGVMYRIHKDSGRTEVLKRDHYGQERWTVVAEGPAPAMDDKCVAEAGGRFSPRVLAALCQKK